nr:hypothetical protein [Alicyclobacillus suci]
MVPLQDFELVPLTIAKDEEAWRERIQGEHLLYKDCESVNGFPHVRYATGQVDISHHSRHYEVFSI